MSEPHARDVAYDDGASASHRYAGPKPTRTVKFWGLPVLLTLVIAAVLSAFYLTGVLQPMTNLRHFPVAIVNEDAGPTGAQVVKGMLASFDHDAYDVRVLDRDQAKNQMDSAQIFGVAVIPPNFSTKLQSYAKSALTPGRVERAVVIVSTNPRAGVLGATIASQALQREVTLIDQRVGQKLSQEVAQQTGEKPAPGAIALMLANPVEVKTTVHNLLPEGTGNGLSAFYYALLLVLAGFIGSIVVSRSVDARLDEQTPRLRTLLIKWAMIAVTAPLTSVAYVAISAKLGMPVQNPLTLWLFGTFAILAVGVTSTSLITLLGAVGVLVSLFVFVILGLPSAGATVPLQATPALFEWQAKFEPMHQVFIAARSLLYLDGRPGSGLSPALVAIAIDLVIGLLLGAFVIRGELRRRRPASPAPVEAPSDTFQEAPPQVQ
ncbi:DUF3533 domain-containing protein [Candidatus Mycobacterium wuenschmannii]|uniref:DUF3533 domain-containing protein n=1 Tax=Candidatus Mycobacterium wuenschmannii TaxID=3027808 RepID=A0ABY8VTN5_9MYCO|nr:ABC transporter permease [Candidatus Mycobacterium wuenschmannii]WIM86985.1 DUF3533 domain-containing protein [Candidatus Mycobacterium wuenschmannii]